MTREQLVASIKERAIEELEGGGVDAAFTSIISDLVDHPEFLADLAASVIAAFGGLSAGDASEEEVRAFINNIK